MLKAYAGIFLLISIGIAAGLLLADLRDQQPATDSPGAQEQRAIAPAREADEQRIAALEANLRQLQARISDLESRVVIADEPGAIEAGEPASVDVAPQAVSRFRRDESPPQDMMIAGLTAAGIDPYTAEDIVRRQNRLELERLDLRDKAIREGTIGTAEFRQQMLALRDQEVTIREEIDENAYESYLYHTGQPNRVAVDSVIMGSAAENSGIQPGDVILRYGNQRVYNSRDLRGATTAGERDEPVAVTISRRGSEMTLTIPRGPLGVRMSASSEDPGQ